MSGGKQYAKIHQATDWPHLILSKSYNLSSTLRGKTGMKLAVYKERQIFLFIPCVYVWVPSTRQRSQYPCPKFDITALVYNIYNAYILKKRPIGATSDMHLFPAKVGAKYAAGPTEPPRMPNFQQMSMI